MRIFPILAAAFLGSASMAAEPTFDANDTDGDGRVSKDEYYGLVDDLGVYPDWDTTSDGSIDEHEFDALGVKDRFDAWDANDDSQLDPAEFRDGIFSNYDLDHDGEWDSSEWRKAREDGWLGATDSVRESPMAE